MLLGNKKSFFYNSGKKYAAEKESTFKTHVRSLIERGVLDVDDMTVVVLGIGYISTAFSWARA